MKAFVIALGAALAFAASDICIAAQGDAVVPALAPYVSTNAKIVVITHVRVIDGTGAPAVDDCTVVLTDGKIAALGSASTVAIPAGATVVDGRDRTLLPGYVGTHNHLFIGTEPKQHHLWRSMPFSFPRLYLAAGTTTIRTTGSMDIYTDMHVKRAIDAGQAPGPAIDLTSPYLTGPSNTDMQMDELTGAADARQTVDFWADHGVTSFKAYANITRESLAAVIDEAHKRHLKVMGHLCSVGFREAAELGIDEFEHGPLFTDAELTPGKAPDVCPPYYDSLVANAKLTAASPEIKRLIADLVRRHIAVSSTLPVYESLFPELPSQVQQPTLDLLDPAHRQDVLAWKAIANTSGPFIVKHPDARTLQRLVFTNEMAFEVAFYRAGGVLTCGPDPSGFGIVIAGLGDWREIELLVRAGLRPVEAIHVATQNGAIALGRADTIGTIAIGKHADLILVDGNPFSTIADIERVHTVFKDGIGYDSKKLIDSVRGIVGQE